MTVFVRHLVEKGYGRMVKQEFNNMGRNNLLSVSRLETVHFFGKHVVETSVGVISLPTRSLKN